MTMPRVNWRQKAEWLERENACLKKKLEEKTLENLIREIAREEARGSVSAADAQCPPWCRK